MSIKSTLSLDDVAAVTKSSSEQKRCGRAHDVFGLISVKKDVISYVTTTNEYRIAKYAAGRLHGGAVVRHDRQQDGRILLQVSNGTAIPTAGRRWSTWKYPKRYVENYNNLNTLIAIVIHTYLTETTKTLDSKPNERLAATSCPHSTSGQHIRPIRRGFNWCASSRSVLEAATLGCKTIRPCFVYVAQKQSPSPRTR